MCDKTSKALVLVLLLLPLLVITNKRASAAILEPMRDLKFNEDIGSDVLTKLEQETYNERLRERNMNQIMNIDEEMEDESEDDEFCVWHKCDNDFRALRGFKKYFDLSFLKKFMSHLNPFGMSRMNMNFYLFKQDFPDSGRELRISDTREDILYAGFNPRQPTRIIIHGWISQSRGSFNRDVKNAYLKRGDFNVIVVDWSASATNVNYFAVVKMIEGFGAQLARFTQHLKRSVNADYDHMYLIGHSLGAQIKPARYNTIFALDPAGPKFRHRSAEFRIDPADAKYVESIQTSGNLGFLEPTGNATFYPNYGFYQRKCYCVGCSHIRAYKMFAESITTNVGFWGTRCKRREPEWECNEEAPASDLYRMGGEPAQKKSGIFYVKTSTSSPFALGSNWKDGE
ncbi:phospholipase A1-like [Rhagoletis pomonella]|uniref:phospholipase A1-like n=1 Tax=Rhagoletis pomonella TaxID=28610 RepID=UPI001781FC89|nr:phospholipase A1-like [Rhagoletis pomonella]